MLLSGGFRLLWKKSMLGRCEADVSWSLRRNNFLPQQPEDDNESFQSFYQKKTKLGKTMTRKELSKGFFCLGSAPAKLWVSSLFLPIPCGERKRLYSFCLVLSCSFRASQIFWSILVSPVSRWNGNRSKTWEVPEIPSGERKFSLTIQPHPCSAWNTKPIKNLI